MNFTTFQWILALIFITIVWGEKLDPSKFNEKEKDAYYTWFGMTRSTFKKETLASKYRELARTYHPDKNKAEGAKEIFIKITKAFDTLNDDKKRSQYDVLGYKATEEGGGASAADAEAFAQDIFKKMFEGFFDMDDFFADFMGGSAGRGRRARGPTSQTELVVNLEDLYLGKKMQLEYSRTKVCTHCQGTGADDPDAILPCDKCGGRGSYVVVQQLGMGFVQQMQVACNVCGGRGKIFREKCKKCGGERTKRAHEHLEVEIPAGASDGDAFRFPGKADEHPDRETGDMIVILRCAEHSRYQRDGSNLYTTVHLTLRQALLGFEKSLLQLDGGRLQLARTEITQPGFVERIADAGMPVAGGTDKGDLFVEYRVVLPARLSSEQRLKLEKVLPKHEHLTKFDEL